jgi:hypothetical protein
MALPPKDDPSRPIALAVNAARVLGVLCLVLGLLAGFGTAAIFKEGSRPVYMLILIGVLVMMFPLPGILYLVFAGAMQRRKQWAAIAVLAIAGLHGALLVLSLVGSLVRGGNNFSLAFTGVLLAVVVLLIVYTAQAIGVIRRGGPQPTGFEPIMPPSTGPRPYDPPPQ